VTLRDGSAGGQLFHGGFGAEAFRDFRKLDADVHALGILAEDDQVDVVAVIQRIAGKGAAGAQADVEIEHLAHADDRAAVGEALALKGGRELARGVGGGLGSDGAKESALGGAQQFQRAGGQGIAFFTPELPADVAVEVLGLESGGVEDHAGGVADFRADAVAGKPGYAMFAHALATFRFK
jgi:hypothetical protein